jgi:hypothetical protein
MPTKPFSEIQADKELLEEIKDKAESGAIEWPDSVVEDATDSASSLLPALGSDEADVFIRAVEKTFDLPHRVEAQESGDDVSPTDPAAT